MATESTNEISIAINNRFFEAVDMLRSQGEIRGLGQLAREWNMSRFALTWSKNHPEKLRIKTDHIYLLAKEHRISLDWIFFGTGPMFRK